MTHNSRRGGRDGRHVQYGTIGGGNRASRNIASIASMTSGLVFGVLALKLLTPPNSCYYFSVTMQPLFSGNSEEDAKARIENGEKWAAWLVTFPGETRRTVRGVNNISIKELVLPHIVLPSYPQKTTVGPPGVLA